MVNAEYTTEDEEGNCITKFNLKAGNELELAVHKCLICGEEQITDARSEEMGGCIVCNSPNTLETKTFTVIIK